MDCYTKLEFSAHCTIPEENTVNQKDYKVSRAQSVFTGAWAEQSENPAVIRLFVHKAILLSYASLSFTRYLARSNTKYIVTREYSLL